MLWVLVIVCLPYAGMLLYLVFDSTAAIKLTSVLRRKRFSKRLTVAEAPKNLLAGQTLSEEDLQVMQFKANYNNSPVICYDDYQCSLREKRITACCFRTLRKPKKVSMFCSIRFTMRSLMVDNEGGKGTKKCARHTFLFGLLDKKAGTMC